MPLSSRFARAPLALLCVALLVRPLAAQRRILAPDHPQALLMGYYSAIMAFTPVGPLRGLEIGAEASYIPSLSEEDRRVGFGGTKLEDTNRCPVMPRLRAGIRRGALGVEAGWVPPATVCGITASILAGAVSWRGTLDANYRMIARANVVSGSLEAAITCSGSAIANPNDLLCFGGTLSDDRVQPFIVGADLMIVQGGGDHAPLELYILAGMRRERIRFDVNFVNPSITNLPGVFEDHERLQTTRTRLHAAGGAGWTLGRLLLGGELYYAPGAVTTLRGRAAILLRRSGGGPE